MSLDWEFCIRLLLAALLGSLVGFERERLLWAAGLRTHMLVSVGACLFMIVSAFGFADVQSMPHIALDPSRVAAQVVSGIGFLGAGSIMMRGDTIRGLTTAASLWTVAAIGLAVGGGLYMTAFAATIIILVILAGIKPLEKAYRSRLQLQTIQLVAPSGSLTLASLNRLLGPRAGKVKHFIVERGPRDGTDTVLIQLKRTSPAQGREIVDILLGVEGVTLDRREE